MNSIVTLVNHYVNNLKIIVNLLKFVKSNSVIVLVAYIC